MALTFYHCQHSTSNVTEAILAELTPPHPTAPSFPSVEKKILSIPAHDTRAPSFLALNPNGRVPTIVHNDIPIWESAAITMYLGEVFGVERGLYPELGTERGEAMKWIVWTNTTLTPAGGRLAAALPRGSEGGVEEGSQDHDEGKAEEERVRKAEEAKKEIKEALGVLEGGLEGREYLVGGRYTLADTHVWCFVGWLKIMGVELKGFEGVTKWADRVGARDALKGL